MKKHKRVNFAGQGINFLTRQQMEEIHSCTLQLLQETGILVQHKGALEMLEKLGIAPERYLRIDNTNLSPEAVAEMIVEHFGYERLEAGHQS